jgi:hypothetical protein
MRTIKQGDTYNVIIWFHHCNVMFTSLQCAYHYTGAFHGGYEPLNNFLEGVLYPLFAISLIN